jgi:hypothetical protein
MHAAIEEHDQLQDDAEAREALQKYFLYTAHYIVVASEFMRPDQVSPKAFALNLKRSISVLTLYQMDSVGVQLSGGTQIDAGRVW